MTELPPGLHNGSAFFASVARDVTNLVSLLDAAESERHARIDLPAADSVAQAELDRQTAAAGAWGDEPIQFAVSIVWLGLATAEGFLRSATDLLANRLRTHPAVLDTLGRAALENLSRSLWIGEPGIGFENRIRRSQTERIYSAKEQARLDPSLQAEAESTIAAVLETARAVGFHPLPSKKQTPPRLANRPSATAAVGQLLLDEDTAGLGQFAYKLYSAPVHGTLYGLARSAYSDGDVTAIALSSDQVQLLFRTLTLAYVSFIDRWFAFLGWNGDAETWQHAVRNAGLHE